jgi:hypothetical protein
MNSTVESIEIIINNENKMPIAKLIDANGEKLGYLLPNDIRFEVSSQLSSTFLGQDYLGGCSVVGLGNIVAAFGDYERIEGWIYQSNWDNLAVCMFHDLAKLAIFTAGFNFDRLFGTTEKFNQFIGLSVEYIQKINDRNMKIRAIDLAIT